MAKEKSPTKDKNKKEPEKNLKEKRADKHSALNTLYSVFFLPSMPPHHDIQCIAHNQYLTAYIYPKHKDNYRCQ